MCFKLAYNSISKFIKSKLALIPPNMIAHQNTKTTLCKLTSFSSSLIFEIHKFYYDVQFNISY